MVDATGPGFLDGGRRWQQSPRLLGSNLLRGGPHIGGTVEGARVEGARRSLGGVGGACFLSLSLTEGPLLGCIVEDVGHCVVAATTVSCTRAHRSAEAVQDLAAQVALRVSLSRVRKGCGGCF